MSEQMQYDTQGLRGGGGALSDASNILAEAWGGVKGDCSDMSAFGAGNDTVGPIAQMIYQAVLDRVEETVTSSTGSWSDHSEKVENAAKVYDRGESDNAEIARMAKPGGKF